MFDNFRFIIKYCQLRTQAEYSLSIKIFLGKFTFISIKKNRDRDILSSKMDNSCFHKFTKFTTGF